MLAAVQKKAYPSVTRGEFIKIVSIRLRERKAGRVKCSVVEGLKACVIKRSLSSNLPSERFLIKFCTFLLLYEESHIKLSRLRKIVP